MIFCSALSEPSNIAYELAPLAGGMEGLPLGMGHIPRVIWETDSSDGDGKLVREQRVAKRIEHPLYCLIWPE